MGLELLVVGGTGFIGRHLVSAAKKRAWNVTSLSINKPTSLKVVDDVEYIVADIQDHEALRSNLKGRAFDYVVNASGYIDHTPFYDGGIEVVGQHFLGVANLMLVIDRTRLKKFVQIGSSEEYGCIPSPQKETDVGQPNTPYGFSKLSITRLLEMLYHSEHLPVCILRIFLTYGPGQDFQRFIPQLLEGCLKNLQFPVSEGNQVRDFCFIDDITRGILLTLETKGVEGKIINLASGDPVKVKEVITLTQRLTGGGLPIWGAVPYRKKESMELYADIEQARELLGWSPIITLEEGLKKMIGGEKNK